ncbi:hypothetical protein P2R64_00195 [Priestia megaterium]|uniref:hypothetical protein n=1 Tax=Priestia megaterium TaxID=1404 RepID=UPI0021BEA919|nr:hypothetical protein [Priestia megaterium]MCT9858233.1 hypothetical protein [Priestia megaterium]MDF1958480.1 hypothetical protein [Priestia megaterium]
MSFENAQEKELYNITKEQSLNNTAAIRVLTQLVMKHGLITEDELNKQVRSEAEGLMQEMVERVKTAE